MQIDNFKLTKTMATTIINDVYRIRSLTSSYEWTYFETPLSNLIKKTAQ